MAKSKAKSKPNKPYRAWQGTIALMLLVAAVMASDIGGFVDPKITEEETGTSTSGTVLYESEFNSSDAPLSGVIYGATFGATTVQYADVEGLPIFEGDIILDLATHTEQGLGVKGTILRWPAGLVPYEIATALPDQKRVRDAIAHWEANTPIRFVERNAGNARQYPNYVYFQPSFGCSSYVGMVGGKQPINLARGCDTGSTIHEIGHAVGLWHEQGRADRDQFIEVHYENIIPGMAFNFDQHISDGDDIGQYDYSSIMHYPKWAFSRNGKDTIIPLQQGVEIGQRKVLSEGDLAAVREMYIGIAVGD